MNLRTTRCPRNADERQPDLFRDSERRARIAPVPWQIATLCRRYRIQPERARLIAELAGLGENSR